MIGITEVKKIDNYLDNYLKDVMNNLGVKKLKSTIIKIMNLNYVDGLDQYSKDILALAMEKRLMLCIEKQRLKNQKSSYWRYYKSEVPLIKNRNDILLNYVDLFIRDIYKDNPQNESLAEIKKFYNTEIYKSTKMITNKMIKIPSGENVSVGDILNAVNVLLEDKNSSKEKHEIEVLKLKVKKVAFIASIVSSLSFVALQSSKVDVDEKNMIIIEIDKENEHNTINNAIKYELNLRDNIHKNTYINREEFIEPESEKEFIECDNVCNKEFIGYDNACSKEYQKYIYDISQKYNIPFNIFMSIVDVESNGSFDNNGKISSTNDYGFCQINIVNHEMIYKKFGYTTEDLLNNPYKNIEAAAFLLKNICDMYKDEITNNEVENVFGTYNGWINWQSKEISNKYVEKNMNLYNNMYNKTDDELFVIESINKKGL